jgi:hypothetical protein
MLSKTLSALTLDSRTQIEIESDINFDSRKAQELAKDIEASIEGYADWKR